MRVNVLHYPPFVEVRCHFTPCLPSLLPLLPSHLLAPGAVYDDILFSCIIIFVHVLHLIVFIVVLDCPRILRRGRCSCIINVLVLHLIIIIVVVLDPRLLLLLRLGRCHYLLAGPPWSVGPLVRCTLPFFCLKQQQQKKNKQKK